MKSLAIVLAGLTILAASASGAVAGTLDTMFQRAANVLGGGITVPTEWGGIWQLDDSLYDCNGVFKNTSSSLDTLCAGKTYTPDNTIACSGTADASTFHIACSGGGLVFADCNYAINLDIRGTRSGDTFFGVSNTSITYSGTGLGCNLLTPVCEQENSHAVRTGPAPDLYCSTPVRAESWGRLKSTYR